MISLADRFWEKVRRAFDDECWEWLACKDTYGYGHIKSEGKTLGAHRVSWELHFGLIPEGMCILHSCDNSSCVNPLHLFLGTKAANAADRDTKGRGVYGEIRRRHAEGEKQCNLAEEFKIDTGSISKIVNYKTWQGESEVRKL